MDCSLPGSAVHGILQARIMEWVAFPPPGDLPDTGIEPKSLTSPVLTGGFFTTNTTWEAPFPSPGDLPEPGIKLWSPALQIFYCRSH